jgi:hypothetical protein
MDALAVTLLISSVLLLCIGGVETAIGLFLWYAISRLQPIEDLEARLMRNNALCEALEAQVAKLRTSKAGRISNSKRQQQEEQEAEDPMLAGLSEEDKALFR